MFSRKKKTPVSRKPNTNANKLGLNLGIPGFDGNITDDDDELEAELFALTGEKPSSSDVGIELEGGEDDLEAELSRILGNTGRRKEKIEMQKQAPKKLKEIDDSVKASLEGSDDDEDVDENDTDLLSELDMITKGDAVTSDESEEEPEPQPKKEVSQVDLIKNRLMMYREAEANAKSKNESSRARRFNRGVKTLEKLLKRAEGGEFVPYNEIPPEVATNLQPPKPISQEIEPPPDSDSQPPPQKDDTVGESNKQTNELEDLRGKSHNRSDVVQPDPEPEESNSKDPDPATPHSLAEPLSVPQVREKPTVTVDDERRLSLLDSLKSRREEFKSFALIAKKTGNINDALSHVKQVKLCDSLIKAVESGKRISKTDIPPAPRASVQRPAPLPPQTKLVPNKIVDNSARSGYIFSLPTTVQEALTQRLEYYTAELKRAETSGLRNEARTNGQKVKIYENAIKLHKKGSELPYEKLPTPPGCPPFPITFKI